MTEQVDLDALEALAKAATPGPRYPTTTAAAMSMNEGERGMVFDSYEPSDRAFFTAFDPPTALTLPARLREAEAVIAGALDVIRDRDGDPDGRIERILRAENVLSRYKTTKTESTDRENGSTER